MKIVVIGASAAGGSLCETARRLDPGAEITLINEEPLPYYSRCLLPLFINGARSRKELQFRPSNWAEDFKLRVMVGKVTSLFPKDKKVLMSSGETVEYDRLGVATGASPHQPSIPGISNRGIYTLYNLQVAMSIKRWLPTAKHIIVLGAGLIGVKAAVAMCEIGKTITLIEQRSTILPDIIDARAARIITRQLEGHGIQVLTGGTITEVRSGQDLKINNMQLASGDVLKCDMLVVAVGTRPNIDLFEKTGAGIRKGVLIDTNMQTGLSGVYAAGDAAEVYRLDSRETVPQANWINSKREGRLAAYNMLGQSIPYRGRLRCNATSFFGLPLVSVGQISAGTGDEDVTEDIPAQIYRRFFFSDNRLVGMIMLGDTAEAGILTTLIWQSRDVASIRHRLLREGAGCLQVNSVGMWQKIQESTHSVNREPKIKLSLQTVPRASENNAVDI